MYDVGCMMWGGLKGVEIDFDATIKIFCVILQHEKIKKVIN